MSKKGSITTTDYIDFDRAHAVAKKLITEKKKINIGLYILIAINTGLRASDLLSLRWSDISAGKLKLKEQKTKKAREIALNDTVKDLYSKYVPEKNCYIFTSQMRSTYSIQQVNRLLKEVFKREAKSKNISSHSLRKGFGRRVWENDNQSERALVYLMELFNHSSLAITKRYLGIRQEELDDIYINL